jgi:DNA transformation protein
MSKATTHTLCVNLSASQVRKRLKGYGFGVRDVQAADRNRAFIIHTATGQHLRELQSLFADVLAATPSEVLGTPLGNEPPLCGSDATDPRKLGE